eukprot:6509003-Karenia_brevis.AAC.1
MYLDTLAVDGGLEQLLQRLSAEYQQRPVVRMGELLEEYFEMTWMQPGELTSQWISRLDRLTKRVTAELKIDIPEQMKVFYLLRGMRLTRPQRAQILAAAGSQYAWKALVTAI